MIGSRFSVSEQEASKQREYTAMVREIIDTRLASKPLAFVHTYGCQGNVSDGEYIKGMLEQMGYGFTDSLDDASLVRP